MADQTQPYYRQESLTREQLLGSRSFLDDASQFLLERTGKLHSDPTKILDNFMEIMRFSMVNEATAFGNLTHVRRSDAAAKDRMGRMFLAFDASTGATGKVQTGLDYLEGLIRAPSTIVAATVPFFGWLGKGAVAGGARAAGLLTRQLALRETARRAVAKRAAAPDFLVTRAGVARAAPEAPKMSLAAKAVAMRDVAKGMGKTGEEALLASLTRGQYMRRGAVRAGLVEAPFQAAHGYAEATAEKETGREEFKDVNVQTRMAIYGGLGLVGGALGGGVAGAWKFKNEQMAMDALGNAFTAQVKKAEAAAGEFDNFLGNLPGGIGGKTANQARATAKQFTEDLRALNEEQVAKGTTMFGRIQDSIAPDSEEFILSLAEPIRKNLINAATEWITLTGLKRNQGERFAEFFARALEEASSRVREIQRVQAPARTIKGVAETPAEAMRLVNVRVGNTSLNELFEIVDKYGLNFAHYQHLLMADASQAAKALRAYGTGANVIRKLTDAMQLVGEGQRLIDGKVTSMLTPDELANYEALAKAVEQRRVNIRAGIENVNKARLGFMTMQTATTIRNTVNAVFRTATYALDNFFQGILRWDVDQMKAGITLGHHLLNPAEAQIIKLIHHMEAPTQVARMYRQLADVAAADPVRTRGMSSWLLKSSMFLNRVNTLSDNMFKQAIFATELSVRMGGRKNLVRVLEQGNFNKIDPKVIAESMQEALHFVYQKSYRGSRAKGKGVDSPLFSERIAHGFIKAFSHPIGSAAIPFPRFLMNSLEFIYTHAPIIGLADPALFLRKIGVTKGYRKVTKTGLRRTGRKVKDLKTGKMVDEYVARASGEYTQRLAQQLTGTAMLYGAIQLRANQGPNARFWESYDEETGLYKDVAAFWGPFLPWLFMADIILHATLLPESFVLNKDAQKKWADIAKERLNYYLTSTDDNRKRKRLLETAKSLGNAQLQKGFGGEVYKEIQQELSNVGFFTDIENDQKRHKTAIAMGKFIGNWFNTFTVAAGEVRDFMTTLNPKMYGTIFSANIQEERPGFMVNLLDQVLRTSLRSFPIKPYEDPETGEIRGKYALPFGLDFEGLSPILPVLPATKTAGEEIFRAGVQEETPPYPYFRQLTGQTPIGQRNLLEEELNRRNLEVWEVFPSIKGDPELTRKARQYYQVQIEKNILPFIASRGYQNIASNKKRRALKRYILDVRGSVLTVLEEQLKSEVTREVKGTAAHQKKNRQLARILRLRLGEADQVIVQEIIEAYQDKFKHKPNLTNVDHLSILLGELKK